MGADEGYWLPRFLFQRGLGLIYLIAFLVAVNQFRPLLGENGLEPVPRFVAQVPFRASPSLFYLFSKDAAFAALAWFGTLLSVLALTGISDRYGPWFSVAVWALLWVVYLSFVNVGQTFYGFGWESMLLEAGFFAIFLGSSNTVPRVIPLWILRWMEFRVMFGAGLIKLRGDPCWRNLTCLDYHYETQPMPNPLSWYFHMSPTWVRHGGVAFNHFVELVVPFGYFLPQPVASIAASLTILFQLLLMLSGNLSFLNLLTIVIAFPMLDGRWLSAILPIRPPSLLPFTRVTEFGMVALAIAVVFLSIGPTMNMISPGQMMNFSFNPLHLVNTYGAFGSVTKLRYEVVVEGTSDAVVTDATKWSAYEFRAKPTDPYRRPPQIAPYHLRLDWLMWFAAMGSYREQPWFIPFAQRLLQGDRGVLGLMKYNPFPNAPPHFLRANLYIYHFTTAEEFRRTHAWWKRELVSPWFPTVSLEDFR